MNRMPGTHPANIKNRSSKNLYRLTKRKPAIRSMSNEKLAKLADAQCDEACREIKRRANLKRNRK